MPGSRRLSEKHVHIQAEANLGVAARAAQGGVRAAPGVGDVSAQVHDAALVLAHMTVLQVAESETRVCVIACIPSRDGERVKMASGHAFWGHTQELPGLVD